jgi:HSP20 family molecular chaperone IbpA
MEKEKTVFDGIDELSDELDTLFDNFSGKAPIAFVTNQKWRPKIDLYECEEKFHVIVELGGAKLEDIHAELNEVVLRVYGKRISSVSSDKVDYHRMEINSGHFERHIRFKCPVDPRSIEANYQGGILYVELKKVPARISGSFPIPIRGI